MNDSPALAASTVSLPRLLAVLIPAMLLVPIAADMVSLVLPLIAEQFTASTARVAWVVTGFLLVCSVGIPIYGRFADRYSIRRLFTVSLALFAIGSLLCALAPNLVVLVAGRMLMGAGGAAIPVLAIVAAARLSPGDRAPVAIGFLGAAGGVGTAAGPVVGGVFGQLLGWPALFWVMTAAALVLIPAIRRVIPGDAPDDQRPFDLLGGLLLGAAAGLLLFGITQSTTMGFGSPASWGVMSAGLAGAALFRWRTRAGAHPFVPPALFGNRGYVAAVAVIFLAMTVNLATLVLVPILVIEVNGLTPGEGSLVMIPGGLALAVTSLLAGRLGQRDVNAGSISLAGLTLIAAAAVLSSVTAGMSPVMAGLAVLALGAGFALVVTATTSAASQLLPSDQIGVGVGIFQGAQFLGASTGPAVFAALLSARQAAGHDAFSPFHIGTAAAFSDAFLALTGVTALAFLAATQLRKAVNQARDDNPRTVHRAIAAPTAQSHD
ncbi:MAG TPA: MFS transporter [Nocardioides sp.]|nr:MFS transporter [Nocardioides sp.]